MSHSSLTLCTLLIEELKDNELEEFVKSTVRQLQTLENMLSRREVIDAQTNLTVCRTFELSFHFPFRSFSSSKSRFLNEIHRIGVFNILVISTRNTRE